MKAIVLGSGTSHGIPMIACDCRVCTSGDDRDRRSRPSIHVQHNDVHVLVDTAPELRLQCLDNDIRRVDAVFFTHHHADHVTGLDDLRRFNWVQGGTIRCYAQAVDILAIKRMFAYVFDDQPDYPSHKPDLEFIPLNGVVEVTSAAATCPQGSMSVLPIPLMHGPTPVLGYRFGGLAYCTDCSDISDASLEKLQGVEVLILDALRRRPHPTHFNLEQAVRWAHRIGAGMTYFTHIAHELLHEEVNKELPSNMQLAYDGQVIEL